MPAKNAPPTHLAEREREREREGGREGGREGVCVRVCVCEGGREGGRVCVCVCEGGREGDTSQGVLTHSNIYQTHLVGCIQKLVIIRFGHQERSVLISEGVVYRLQ